MIYTIINRVDEKGTGGNFKFEIETFSNDIILRELELLDIKEKVVIKVDNNVVTVDYRKKKYENQVVLNDAEQIFISHSSKEKELLALPLYASLKSFNLNPWIDKEDMQKSDYLFSEISDAIYKSNCYILIISPEFMVGKWTNKELEAIYIQHVENNKKVFIILHQVSIDEFKRKYSLLSGLIAWDTSKDIQNISREISSIVNNNEKELVDNSSQKTVIQERSNQLEITNALSTLFQFIPYTNLLVYINDFPEYFSMNLSDIEDMWNRFKISNPHQYPFKDEELNIKVENFFENQRDIEELVQKYFDKGNFRINCFDSIIDYNGTNHKMKINHELNDEERKIVYDEVNRIKPLYKSNYCELTQYIRNNYPNVVLNAYIG
jgi:ribosomal protein L14E/L6E/L27E